MCNTIERLMMFMALAMIGSSAFADQPPNIVLIVTDNQSEQLLGAYGNRDIKTPNIDALANAA